MSPRASPARASRSASACAIAAVVVVVVAAAAAALLVLAGCGGGSRQAGATNTTAHPAAARTSAPALLARSLTVTLPAPLQDAAAVPLAGERALLLGGLDASDTSVASVTALGAAGALARPPLALAQHDAQAAVLGGLVYVFGGGQVSSYDHILSYDPLTGHSAQVGQLPTPTSDAAVTALGGTAYVVGGYDGQQPLDTIVAFRPGAGTRVVARLPYGVRYAAVAATPAGQLLIAGGSRGEAPTATILAFDPASGSVRRLGTLPRAVTHAAAVALGAYVYVLGGRGAAPDAQTAAIIAIDPISGRSAAAGRLPRALSDAMAIGFGGHAWLVGGRGTDGEPVATTLALTLAPASASSAAR